MKNEDLLSIVQELPLYVQFTLYRKNQYSPTLSLVSPNDANSTLSQTSLRNLSPDTSNLNVLFITSSLFTKIKINQSFSYYCKDSKRLQLTYNLLIKSGSKVYHAV